MKYTIKQPSLTKEQKNIVNNNDRDSYPGFYELYLDIKSKPTQEKITKGSEFYKTTGHIIANSLDGVFYIGNVWEGYETCVEHVGKGMYSLSVGDIIVDENNVASVVCGRGFKKVSMSEAN